MPSNSSNTKLFSCRCVAKKMDSAKIEKGANTATVEITVIEVWYGIDTSLVERGCGAAILGVLASMGRYEMVW